MMNTKTALSEKIAGEITLSPKPGLTMRKWRNIFDISQTDLAKELALSPSVISDYESGRRKSPGIQTVKRVIEALISIDQRRGGSVIHQYDPIVKSKEGIIEIMEYPFALDAETFIKAIDGCVVTKGTRGLKNQVKGFTLVDSIKTIEHITPVDYAHLYGWSPERALIFTGIQYGRSPMIAVRVHPVKPSLVAYHKPSSIDPLAIKLADRENIPLVSTNVPLLELKERLLALGRGD